MPSRMSSSRRRPGRPKVYKDPAVYLARYQYRLQQKLPHASEDLEAALKLRRPIPRSC